MLGGEDTAQQAENELLLAGGHKVMGYFRDNDEIRRYRWSQKATLPARTLWAWDSYAGIREFLRRNEFDVAHFHNTFPLISPAAYYACRDMGVPVVQTLHNSRMFCPGASFERNHRVCQDCLGKKLAWPGVVHGCYRGSRAQTSVVAAMLALHWKLKTWEKLVDCYLATTEFYRRLFVELGLPAEKIIIKPHFVEDHGVGNAPGDYALFVGRLKPEKGVPTLLEAWKKLGFVPLKIRGEGPLKHRVQQLAGESGSVVELLPRLAEGRLFELMRGARFLIWPSEGYYETFGYVAVEAFSCGLPVIASRVGVAEEIVEEGRTGLHFNPGDADDLATKVEWAWTHTQEMAAMGRAARTEYLAKYTPERNYKMLMQIYNGVTGKKDHQLQVCSR